MAATARPHILIVDDDPGVRESLASALGPTYTISSAATGAEALACLAERPVHGVILDVSGGAKTTWRCPSQWGASPRFTELETFVNAL